jgi:ribosomal protein S18 acetylase RimI-like enzyme
MGIRIETAAEKDIPQILALLREFAEYENLSQFCEATDESLRAGLFGADATAEAILAFAAERAVGYAIFYPNFSSFRGQRGLYLEDLYVTGDYRKKGIGEMLVKHLARLAAGRGYERIDFQVLDWNAPAIRFYESLGARRDDTERHFKFTDEAFRQLSS